MNRSPGDPTTRAKFDPTARAKLAERLAAKVAVERITARPAGVRVPLSASQRALWLDSLVHPDSIAYNQQITLRATGPLDDGAVTSAWRALVARHESLHTVVGVDPGGLPFARLLRADEIDAPVRVEQIARVDADDHIRDAARVPFVLEHDVPARLLVLHHAPGTHTVVVIAHHIALDNVSAQRLVEEFFARYDAAVADRDLDLPKPSLQYGDYAIWQAERLAGPRGAELARFWATALANVPPLELPTDRPRAARGSSTGRRSALDRGPALLPAIAGAANALGVTPYMFLFAAFAATLARWSGQSDFAVGTPMAGRDRIELQDLIGFVSNTVAVPVHLGGNPTWREIVSATKAAQLDAFAHADFPFERVVETVNPPRDPSRNPIFQVNFRIVPTGRARAESGGVVWQEDSVDLGYAKFDLALQLYTDGELTGHVEYDSNLFDAETAEAFATAYCSTLQRVVDDPDVPLLALAMPIRTRATATTPTMRRPRRRD